MVASLFLGITLRLIAVATNIELEVYLAEQVNTLLVMLYSLQFMVF